MAVQDSFDIVLAGATGDLATRKLLPALYRRHAAGQFTAQSRVMGVSNVDCTRDEFIASIEEPLKVYTAGSWGPSASSALISREGLAWSDEL